MFSKVGQEAVSLKKRIAEVLADPKSAEEEGVNGEVAGILLAALSSLQQADD